MQTFCFEWTSLNYKVKCWNVCYCLRSDIRAVMWLWGHLHVWGLSHCGPQGSDLRSCKKSMKWVTERTVPGKLHKFGDREVKWAMKLAKHFLSSLWNVLQSSFVWGCQRMMLHALVISITAHTVQEGFVACWSYLGCVVRFVCNVVMEWLGLKPYYMNESGIFHEVWILMIKIT